MEEQITVIGLGYVGLPVALAFARKFPGCVGFDLNQTRIAELRDGHDRNGETARQALVESSLELTSDATALADTTIYIVAVPTPVDENNVPDFTPLKKASELVGSLLKKGQNTIVCYESTVYPGATEEVCGPILEAVSGLKRGEDFTLAYSPERINPGDLVHTLETVPKVVSGEDAPTLERIAGVYGAIIPCGVHRAPSIKVAEAAKVIENTQRDLNIALMNELALIFDRMGIRTRDVLAAAGTKWNFLPFKPGLVGGHCIGVDPYYLTTKALQLGYQPQVILAGRRTNNDMGPFLAQRMAKLLIQSDISVRRARVGVLGLTFKENVSDIRNSKVPDVIRELEAFGMDTLVHDPLADRASARHEYGINLASWEDFHHLDGLVVAVAHEEYVKMGQEKLLSTLRKGGVVMDVKSILDPARVDASTNYWCL